MEPCDKLIVLLSAKGASSSVFMFCKLQADDDVSRDTSGRTATSIECTCGRAVRRASGMQACLIVFDVEAVYVWPTSRAR